MRLADLIEATKDGEWGSGEPTAGSVEVAIIRGTDFASASRGVVSRLPVRYVASRHVAAKQLRPNDIIIETAGGSRGRPTGRTFRVTDEFLERCARPVLCASFCRFIRLNTGGADAAYVYWWLQSLYAAGRMTAFNTQHTGVSRFQWTVFASSTRIALPTRGIQLGVACALAAFDELIAISERRIELLEDLARSLYCEWFMRYRFPGADWTSASGESPPGWTAGRLGDVAEINAYTAKGNELPDPLRYVDISSVSPRRIEESRVLSAAEAPGRARRRLRDGDTIWATVRPNRRSHALVHDPPEDMIASTGFAVLTPNGIPAAFLFEYTSRPEFADYLMGRATGAAYPAVRPPDFEEAPVLIPPPDLLAAFGDLADPALRLASHFGRQIAALARTRDLLLPRLITGRLDISDVDLGDLLPAETPA